MTVYLKGIDHSKLKKKLKQSESGVEWPASFILSKMITVICLNIETDGSCKNFAKEYRAFFISLARAIFGAGLGAKRILFKPCIYQLIKGGP